jgi:hypothetical protein
MNEHQIRKIIQQYGTSGIVVVPLADGWMLAVVDIEDDDDSLVFLPKSIQLSELTSLSEAMFALESYTDGSTFSA